MLGQLFGLDVVIVDVSTFDDLADLGFPEDVRGLKRGLRIEGLECAIYVQVSIYRSAASVAAVGLDRKIGVGKVSCFA